MFLKSIFLQNFRNFSKKEFEFSDRTTLIIGPNASGKTNLLEAIYLLATGKSFRAELEAEMISYESQLSVVRCSAFAEATADRQLPDGLKLEMVLTKGEVNGEKTAKKICRINGVNKKLSDFVGNLRAVYFGPEDLELITNSPSTRRKYLDMVLSQVDREYARASLSYEKGLRARNKVLEAIRETGAPRTQLYFWDQLLIKNGELITRKREEHVDFVNNFQFFPQIAGSRCGGTIHNDQSIFKFQFSIEYDKSVISATRLEQYKEEEVAAGATLVGPHRDDIKFEIRSSKSETTRNLSAYGSRGEQRLAILWLKLCELAFIKEKTGELPILLLDDIFSELDQECREMVWKVVGDQQTIITTADIEQIEKKEANKAEVVRL